MTLPVQSKIVDNNPDYLPHIEVLEDESLLPINERIAATLVKDTKEVLVTHYDFPKKPDSYEFYGIT